MFNREEKAQELKDKYEKRYGVDNTFFDHESFVNYETKMRFICLKHNEEYFKKFSPAYNLNETGCKLCQRDKRRRVCLHTTESLLEAYKKAHPDKGYTYNNYDFNNYVNWQTKITITCPIHGDFSQESNSHIQGCRLSKMC